MRVKVAVAQMDPVLGGIAQNLKKTIGFINTAAAEGAKLVVFPECSLTGYCFNNEEEIKNNALTVGDEWTRELTETARQANVYTIVGFLESFAGKTYNSSLVIGPNGIAGTYRKAHLPSLGLDNFVSPGSDEFSLVETSIGKLGVLICYDIRFPEQARILALQGADILVHITNLPLTASSQVDYLLPARAIENRVYVVSSDRVGEERGFRFLGRSSIFGVNGETLAQANETDETVIYAELDLQVPRQKKVFYPAMEGKPVDHVNDLTGSRRPELYSPLIKL
ncbi:carbon-nitrogen hydrolase family protein [Effusibacillus lacus]|uniref:Amidohydrolase n=1 Tax=Effusibacillus lacus TaxID=1348429 RepID=A0A292YQW8_9BACL|nr:carbon-nitrogen hydrolase family protein [Effusibacillus lacus]TCS72561.1 putative amidohydrolase [Effusibacillus lacus]GAX90880.1 amidohydrolase [Effusibacillus lacus]